MIPNFIHSLPSSKLNSVDPFFWFSLRLCVSAFIVLSISCSSKPTDPRTVVPGDALIYLETSDLGRTLSAITENPRFAELAAAKPHSSAIDGMRVSIAVTGFETSEQQVTEENSVLNFQPRFVAVAETNAWSWQTAGFVENKLGEFVNEVYGGEVQLETLPKNDGKYYIWTAQDGRKAFALVQGSVIFFGNDETAIDKCLAVKRGETQSIAGNPKISAATQEQLGFGYISTDGAAQLANFAGISLALNAGEEDEVKSFIARILPEILRNSIKEVTWTATKGEQGIEDRFTIGLAPELVPVFSETLVPSNESDTGLVAFLPAEVVSATVYDLRNPQIAWRSLVLSAQKQTDAVSGNLIGAFSGSLFEPYAIEDPEAFLSAVGPKIMTARFDAEGENSVVIATASDRAKIKTSLAKELNFRRPAERHGAAEVWRSENGEIASAFVDNKLIAGDAESVMKCLQTSAGGPNLASHPLYREWSLSRALAATVAKDTSSAAKIVEVLVGKQDENTATTLHYVTETRFNQNGIERRTISDFGLIGSIIEQLEKDQ